MSAQFAGLLVPSKRKHQELSGLKALQSHFDFQMKSVNTNIDLNSLLAE